MKRAEVMGVVNVTPDSFSDGGHHLDSDRAVERARHLVDAGAAYLDIGGESTRPGAEAVPAQVELERVLPVITGLEGVGVPISIDTTKSVVAGAALEAGATIVNDVSAFRGDPDLAAVCAERKAVVVLMHAGDPLHVVPEATGDPVEVVKSFLVERIEVAVQAGIEESRIWIDPGIGFGKSNPEGNLELIGRIAELGDLGRPILIGPSRKSFIGHVDGSPVAERVGGTIASCLIATDGGADVLRVHDVGAVVQSLNVAAAIREASGP